MIAVKRLQSLFWVLLVALGALGAYLSSLRAATERNELMRVRTQISQARSDIRYLETELASRSSIRQLERWNAEDFRYSALQAGQYLEGERDLAQLDGVAENGPAYIAPPVMVAMIDPDSPDDGAGASGATISPATLQIRSDTRTIRTASAVAVRDEPVGRANLSSRTERAVPEQKKGAKKTASPTRVGSADKADKKENAVARKAERMAMLDARLLDDRTLGDIGRKAAAEKRKGLN